MDLVDVDDMTLLEALNVKIEQYSKGFNLVKEYTEKSAQLRNDIEVLRKELSKRYEEQRIAKEQTV